MAADCNDLTRTLCYGGFASMCNRQHCHLTRVLLSIDALPPVFCSWLTKQPFSKDRGTGVERKRVRGGVGGGTGRQHDTTRTYEVLAMLLSVFPSQ